MTIPGVCEKNGSFYRRFKVRQPDGSRKDLYVKLPHPTAPNFREELERINADPANQRPEVIPGSVRALAIDFRVALGKGWTKKTRKKGAKPLAQSTMDNYLYYVGLLEEQHGHRLVKQIRPKHIYLMRDELAATPGKANNLLNVVSLMMHFAVQRDWRDTNPADNVGLLPIGEHEPWPADVLAEAIAAASPMLRLAIVSGLCSGQRVSDVILLQHNWLKTGTVELSQVKTGVDVAIPVHPWWREEIARVPKKAVTLLYDRFGKPFSSEDRIQERIRRLMHDLGHVDENGQLLFTFHGLRKNACCYLLELGLSDTEVGAILGMTPETVRHYGKRARAYMIARGAAKKMVGGKILRLVGETTARGNKKTS